MERKEMIQVSPGNNLGLLPSQTTFGHEKLSLFPLVPNLVFLAPMSMKPEHAKRVARAWNKKWTYKKRTKVATTADAGSALQKLKSFDVVFDPLGLLLCYLPQKMKASLGNGIKNSRLFVD